MLTKTSIVIGIKLDGIYGCGAPSFIGVYDIRYHISWLAMRLVFICMIGVPIGCGLIISNNLGHFLAPGLTIGKKVGAMIISVGGLCNHAKICEFTIGWTYWISCNELHNSSIIYCKTLDEMNGQLRKVCISMIELISKSINVCLWIKAWLGNWIWLFQ